jgi:hypothetical protein
VKFRSHTEAKWAIFWDELGIKWEYEPQGFSTDGSCYLPDFVIFPALGTVWVEIKATWDADPDGEAKWRLFAAQRPQPSRTIFIAGVPSIHNKPILIGGDEDAEKPIDGPWEVNDHEWRPCPSGHHFDLGYPGTFSADFAEDGCPDDFGGNGERRIADASAKALSAHDFRRHSDPEGTAA